MDFGKLADKSLEGQIPEREEMMAVLNALDEELPELRVQCPLPRRQRGA